MAAYNGRQFIRKQIESILGQNGVTVFAWIVDDASTDGTAELAESFVGTGRVSVERRPVGTGSAARNFLNMLIDVDARAFDYIALSDHDDIWLPDKLLRAATALRCSDAGGYSSSVTAFWPDGRTSLFRQSASVRAADFLFEGGGQGCTYVLTRQFFEQLQMAFRLNQDLIADLLYHDWAIYAVARVSGRTWHFDDVPTICYRQHASNDTGARLSFAGLGKRLRMLRSGQYSAQMRTITELCMRISPDNRPLLAWLSLAGQTSSFKLRMRRAIFSMRHGRRRLLDRTLTSCGILLSWI